MGRMPNKYAVHARIRGGMGQPEYTGKTTVWACSDREAETRARRRLRRTYRDYPARAIQIKGVERLADDA